MSEPLGTQRTSRIWSDDIPCVHHLLSRTAERFPDAIALTTQTGSLTYRQLNRRANALALELIDIGVRPDTIVGIMADRSIAMIIGMMAILKAGGAYLPLDPSNPPAYSTSLLDDCRAIAVLLPNHTAVFKSYGHPTIAVSDIHTGAYGSEFDESPNTKVSDKNLAYVIYTSGSSGPAKGTLTEHQNLLSLLRAALGEFSFLPSDVWSLFHSCTFDFSVWEIWGALTTGARIAIVPHDTTRSPRDFFRFLRTQGVTILNQTPTALRLLLESISPSEFSMLGVREIICGGEPLILKALPPWLEAFIGRRVNISNMYGITETTIHATNRRVTSLSDTDNIGGPLDHLTIHVLDDMLNEVPLGSVGEIYIGGPALARGYLNRPGLTATRFVANPFDINAGTRLYRSGDLATRKDIDLLQYRGRSDSQLKIRGFRVEPSEVEAAIRQLPSIEEAIVVADERMEHPVLTALIKTSAASLEPQRIRKALQGALPEHLVPSKFLRILETPLTRNGKIDRAAALACAESFQTRTCTASTPSEMEISKLFCEILKLDEIECTDSFFALGGDSIHAAQLSMLIRSRFGKAIEVSQILAFPTVTGLAKLWDCCETSPALPSLSPSDQVPLSFAQERIFFLQFLNPLSNNYNSHAIIEIIGSLNLQALGQATAALVEKHEVYRSTFHATKDGATQRAHDPYKPEVLLLDLRHLGEHAKRSSLQQRIRDLARRPFAPAALPLIRFALFKLSDRCHILAIIEHHLVHDGWSFNVCMHDLWQYYIEAQASGHVISDHRCHRSFHAYCKAQRDPGRRALIDRQINWWLVKLRGRTSPTPLPFHTATHSPESSSTSSMRLNIDAALWRSMTELCRRQLVTPFVCMAAAFKALLYRYTPAKYVNIGTSFANRELPELSDAVGMLVDTIVLSTDVNEHLSFVDLMGRVRNSTLEAQANADAPYHLLVNALGLTGRVERQPLFHAMFSFHDSPICVPKVPGLDIAIHDAVNNGSSRFDLNITVIPHSPARCEANPQLELGAATMVWDYNTAKYAATSITPFIANFAHILSQVVDSPESTIGTLNLLPPANASAALTIPDVDQSAFANVIVPAASVFTNASTSLSGSQLHC